MKILFATDLHGHPARYDALEKVAADFRPAIAINGGDMLPHGSDMTGVQRRFVEGRLDEDFLFFDTAGMDYLFMPGNDDLASLDGLLSKVAGRYRRIHPIAQRHIEIGGYSFIGMNLVTDYPFRLKDRCRMDMRRFEFPAQRGGACFSSGNGWREMSTEEWFVTARSLPTIEDELERLSTLARKFGDVF